MEFFKAFESIKKLTKIEIKKEDETIEKTKGFLIDLMPDKYKKEATAMLAAFSIFTSASSAFAEGREEEKSKIDLFPKNVISETVAREDVDEKDDFAWIKSISNKIELSFGVETEDISNFKAELIESNNYNDIKNSEFFKDLSQQEYDKSLFTFVDSINKSKNAKEFFDYLNKNKETLNDKEKVLFLKELGFQLEQTYDYDMFANNDHVEISDEKMFLGVKNGEKTGICGNIHTFLTKTAKLLGMEAWLQSGFQKGLTKESGGNHIFSGLITEIDGKKQIVFLNYNTLIPTGTLNYRDAIGVWERQNESIATFNSYVGNESEVLFPVKSRGQEIIEKSAGIEETRERLESELKTGELKKDMGIEINLSPEIKEFKITKNTIGLAFLNYQDVYNNPYQSLEDLTVLRGRWAPKGERLGLESDVAVIHGNIKDLYGGYSAFNELIGRLAIDYINNSELSKGDYGRFVLNYGAAFQAGLRLPLDRKISQQTIGEMGEGFAGAQLIYFDPNNIGKFYIGASEAYRGQINDFQNQDLFIKKAAENFIVGAEVKAFEGKIINLEAGLNNLDWGKSLSIKGGLAGEKLSGEIGYEEKSSGYERFIPSSDKISAEIGYKGGPKWEINIIGAKATEKYKDAKSADIYSGEVKLKMFLW